MPFRILGFAPLASGITLSLFWLMTLLVATSEMGPRTVEQTMTPWVKVRTMTPVEPIRPEKPTRPDPPITPKVPASDFNPTAPTFPGVRGEIGSQGGDGGAEHRLTRLSNDNGEATPLVRIPPRYPQHALRRGTEGRVLVEFTINRTGGVEGAHVVRAEPPGIFNREAIRAVEQWRYAPKVIGGKAVMREGMRIAIPFRKGGRESGSVQR